MILPSSTSFYVHDFWQPNWNYFFKIFFKYLNFHSGLSFSLSALHSMSAELSTSFHFLLDLERDTITKKVYINLFERGFVNFCIYIDLFDGGFVNFCIYIDFLASIAL